MSDPSLIWIVERVRDEHYGSTKYVVSWHRSLIEAEAMAARLKAEFDRAGELAWPWHEVVETLWEMLQEAEHVRYVWIDCRETCEGTTEGMAHQHLVTRDIDEHEDVMITQLSALWHAESRAWQIFVEDKIMPLMADPPRFCRELVAPQDDDHEGSVSYVCHVIGHDPAVARAARASSWRFAQTATEEIP